MPFDARRTVRGALAGAVGGAIWAAQQPLDKRVFRSRYDDVELLGKMVTRRRAWRPVGVALHVHNGALFGAVYANVAPLLPLPPATRGPLIALVEHVGLWPLGRLSDRAHPARRELPALAGDRRAFAQGAWRHLLFGLVLGTLERRLNPPAPEPPAPVAPADVAATNGHAGFAAVPGATPAR